MHAQATDSLAAWPEEITPSHGTHVLSGYGVAVRVWRGRLRVSDGIGYARREALVHRATGRLRRLVVIGHTGSVSLEAIRWLADVGASYLQIDADGRVLAVFGPLGSDRPSLRRAQASALDSPLGNDIARRLLAGKVGGQAQTLAALAGVGAVTDETVEAMRLAAGRIHVGVTRDDLRLAEAQAAAAYWSAWSSVPLRFARRDADRVASHWRTFGGRSSPLTGNPRLAGNPANAMLNYLYAVLEGEASIAARVVGLDPGLGVLHADQTARDSLSADLMEPIRPHVNRYLLNLLETRSFAASDFFETRQGVCRVTPPLAHELAQTAPHWGRLVGTIAEDVAALLDGRGSIASAAPTPISGRNRSAGRGADSKPRTSVAPAPSRRCTVCGTRTPAGRDTCGPDCEAEARDDALVAFGAAGTEALARFRTDGGRPEIGGAARRRIAVRSSELTAAAREWQKTHPWPKDLEASWRENLPRLAEVSPAVIAAATGLSLAYCRRVKRGLAVPHPMWWETLRQLVAAEPAGADGRARTLRRPIREANEVEPCLRTRPRRPSVARAAATPC